MPSRRSVSARIERHPNPSGVVAPLVRVGYKYRLKRYFDTAVYVRESSAGESYDKRLLRRATVREVFWSGSACASAVGWVRQARRSAHSYCAGTRAFRGTASRTAARSPQVVLDRILDGLVSCVVYRHGALIHPANSGGRVKIVVAERDGFSQTRGEDHEPQCAI